MVCRLLVKPRIKMLKQQMLGKRQGLIESVMQIVPKLHQFISSCSSGWLKLPLVEHIYGKAGRMRNKICIEDQFSFVHASCDMRVPLFHILRKGERKQFPSKSLVCPAQNFQTRAHLLKFTQIYLNCPANLTYAKFRC